VVENVALPPGERITREARNYPLEESPKRPPAAYPIVLVGLASGWERGIRARPIPNSMTKRGLQLLQAHIRSLDPDEPTARERLDEALGEPLARLLCERLRFGARLGPVVDGATADDPIDGPCRTPPDEGWPSR